MSGAEPLALGELLRELDARQSVREREHLTAVRMMMHEHITTLRLMMQEHTCGCGLDESQRREMGHLMGMVKDAGGGDTSKGVELLRDLLKIHRRVTTCIGSAVVAVVGAAALALCIWIGSGVWAHFKAGVR